MPIAVGHAGAAEVAAAVERATGGGESTLVVVSTDLSHYLAHADAVEHDRRTADSVLAGEPDAVRDVDACGAYALRGLMAWAARRGLRPELLDLRTSADTAGPPDRVVGYGAFAYFER